MANLRWRCVGCVAVLVGCAMPGDPLPADRPAPDLPPIPAELAPGGPVGVVPVTPAEREPRIVASGLVDPSGLVADGGDLYFIMGNPNDPERKERAIARVSGAGGTLEVLALGRDAFRLALDAGALYWTDPATRRISRLGRGTREPTTLVATGAEPLYLAADGESVFWAEVDGSVWRVAPAGGPRTRLGAVGEVPAGLAVAGRLVFVADVGGALHVLPAHGGQPFRLAGDQSFPGGIVADETAVYWVDDHDRAVERVARGGGPVTTLIDAQYDPRGLALDGPFVYFTTAADGAIKRTPRRPVASAPPGETLLAGQSAPAEVAVAGASVFWLDVTAGRLCAFDW